MLTTRRVLLLVAVLLVAAAAWSAWIAWQTASDLREADAAVDRVQAAIESGDDAARDDAITDLRDAAESAESRTDGLWWAAMTKAPALGDDAAGVEALSASIDVLAAEALAPLAETADSLDGLVGDGRVDPVRVEQLQGPVSQAAVAMRRAADLVAAQESDQFVSVLKERYDDYAGRVQGLADDIGAAETAVDVLPSLLGADGPRDYLFIFQNNAEIRSTGGLPGSWARVHVDDGNVELREQGSAGDFNTGQSVTQLTDEEDAVYDQLPALFFQDPNFIPDFPRAAELFDAFWRTKYPEVELDGVLTLDPVGMSYILAGTGPIQAGDVTLTAGNIVDELLSNTYLTIADPAEQDERFQAVARAIFEASTSQLASPIDFVEGFARAARERRFLIAPFADEEAARLDGTAVTGQLTGDDGATPHVDVGLNDATGSKMSYYLRYDGAVVARSCSGGVQELGATMSLSQTVSPQDALGLPDYVTGGDRFGIPVGSQLVTLRIYGPHAGTIENVLLEGESLDPEYGLMIDGRPVVTVGVLIDSTEPVELTWDMTSGEDQTGVGEVSLTPGVEPGSVNSSFDSACDR